MTQNCPNLGKDGQYLRGKSIHFTMKEDFSSIRKTFNPRKRALWLKREKYPNKKAPYTKRGWNYL